MKIFFLTLLFFIAACYQPKQKPNHDLISKEKFISVLKEIHLENSNSKNNHILKKHNISEEKFQKTIEYYSADINEINKIYDSVLDELIKEKSGLSHQ